MARSALENVVHMARNTGGAKRLLAGKHKAGEVEKVVTQPGTIAPLRLSRRADLRIARQKASQGTTSNARILARAEARIISGATLSTAGTTAVQKLRSQSLREGGGPVLGYATQWESLTNGV